MRFDHRCIFGCYVWFTGSKWYNIEHFDLQKHITFAYAAGWRLYGERLGRGRRG